MRSLCNMVSLHFCTPVDITVLNKSQRHRILLKQGEYPHRTTNETSGVAAGPFLWEQLSRGLLRSAESLTISAPTALDTAGTNIYSRV
ncbi:hypothetical protein AAFF_G00267330 [Aldrovandia affinis]|uniref:Uncharacterized protein n=1 Tax=Aldrovandia affinis TaxID=143900 RepID=A0AAD7RDW9_9TELE|nr:hypothetical protein AAFF_G00267330 [Aldrovandia affinis]